MAPYQSAPRPPNEKERLEELYRLGILDTAAEERFDRFTQLVADLFDAPTAFLSFIDRNRQWVKSSCGVPYAGSERDIAFCDYTILEPELLVIPDATRDPRFASNPMVLDPPHVRFYAGAVLRSEKGYALGTLCIVDHAPREMSDREQTRLLTVARMVEQELRYEYKFQEIRRQAFRNAHYDTATGLPNANLLLDRVNQAITVARRSSYGLLVAIVDLHPLTDVLSIVGKESGDRLLRACGERLTAQLNPACTVARWRGDLFAVLLPTLQPDEATTFLQLVRTAFREPVVHEGRIFQFDALCGAAAYPDTGVDADTLMAGAQTALRECQQAPHSHFRIHTLEVGLAMNRRLELETNLRAAVASNALDVVYQPIVEIETGSVLGVEALTRWDEPSIGTISTDEFIRLAEQTTLILDIDQFALARAARQIRNWNQNGLERLTLSVNISGKTLLQENLSAWLQAAIAGTYLDPSRVILEITENHLVTDVALAQQNIESARKLGFRFAIDDFGSGFSSLNYLTKLSVDEIKLDRAFTREMTERNIDASIARTLIAMARELDIPIVAEGVETYEQLLYLKAYQCKDAQGFYLHRPLSADKIKATLARVKTGPRPH